MKKANKNVIGLFGLVLVFAMTVFAAFLPGPTTSAVSGVTDTVIITVQNPAEPPVAVITNPDSGSRFLTPDRDIEVRRVNIRKYKLTMSVVGQDGNTKTATIAETEEIVDLVNVDPYAFRPIAEQYGYGVYTFTLDAIGIDGSVLQDTIEFEYAAIDAEPKKDEETDTIYVDLDFDQDQESLTEDLKIDYVVINIYNEDGELMTEISPVVVKPPVGRVELPFNEKIPSGKYILVAQPYNSDNVALYQTITMEVDYDGGIVVPSTADTGGLFKNLNISQADYLITGLGLFFTVGIGGLIFMCKKSKTPKRRK